MEHFDPERVPRLVERYRVTHTQVVPTMFVRMLKLPEEVRARYDLSSLQCVDPRRGAVPGAGEAADDRVVGPDRSTSTTPAPRATASCYCNSRASGWPTRAPSASRSLGTLHIVGDDGEELPTGEAGTIYFEGGGAVRVPQRPREDALARIRKGWSTLGDVGYLDDDGFLYLTDRKAYMIISGGVNIYPQEAENVLVTHPKVVDVAVFGVPNDDFGEEVKAVVQPVDMRRRPGRELEQELIAFCRSQLADVKCPRSIDFRAELPRHPTGKLYKRLLKDEYWEGHGPADDRPNSIRLALATRAHPPRSAATSADGHRRRSSVISRTA